MFDKEKVLDIDNNKNTSLLRNDIMKKRDLRERYLLEQKEIDDWFVVENQVLEEKIKILKQQQEELREEKRKKILKARENLK